MKKLYLAVSALALFVVVPAQAQDINGMVNNAMRQAQQASSDAMRQAGMPMRGSGQNFMNTDLKHQSFHGQNLKGASFSNFTCDSCDFSGAILDGATLMNVDFTNSSFVRTDFRGAHLTNVTFSGGDLRGSNVDGAVLYNVDFTDRAKLNGVNFTNSQMTNVDYDGANFEDSAVVTSEQIERKLLAGGYKGKPANIDLSIQFAYNSDKILPAAWPQIEELSNALASSEMIGNVFEIDGHTDSAGTDEYNMDLSYRRALSVRKALVEQFSIHPANLRTKGFGESQPVASNDEEYGRALNRRVTIVNLGRVSKE